MRPTPPCRIDNVYSKAPAVAELAMEQAWKNAAGPQNLFVEAQRNGFRFLWKTGFGLDFWELSVLISPYRYKLLCKDDHRIRTVVACEIAPVKDGWELRFDREVGGWAGPVILNHLQNVAYVKTNYTEIWEKEWQPYLRKLEGAKSD